MRTEATAQDAICAAHGTPPLVAFIFVGNLRSFHDPRVYRSIRSNLIEAIGAPSVSFIWGKLDEEHVRGERRDGRPSIEPGAPDDAGARSAQRIEQYKHAADYLAAGRTNAKIVLQIVNSTDIRINPRCPWMRKLKPESMRLHFESAYVGQLHSHAMGYRMLAEYEAEHRVSFGWVGKVRLDALWLASVRPWCIFQRGTAYLASPQAADWFALFPRTAAAAVLDAPYQRYTTGCATELDMLRHEANCCGGGPTAQMMGALMEARLALVGPPYEGSKWGNAPSGSYVDHTLFPLLVMRDKTYNEWCREQFLPHRWAYFADQLMCERILEPEAVRYNLSQAPPLRQAPPPQRAEARRRRDVGAVSVPVPVSMPVSPRASAARPAAGGSGLGSGGGGAGSAAAGGGRGAAAGGTMHGSSATPLWQAFNSWLRGARGSPRPA